MSETEDETVTVGITIRSDAPSALVDEVDAFAQLLGATHQINVSITQLHVCRACGCTDDEACFGGCWWVTPEADICSACAPEEAATVVDSLRLPVVQKIDTHAPRAAAPTIDPEWKRRNTSPVVCPACETEIAVPDASNLPSIDVKCPDCAHRWTQLRERAQ